MDKSPRLFSSYPLPPCPHPAPCHPPLLIFPPRLANLIISISSRGGRFSLLLLVSTSFSLFLTLESPCVSPLARISLIDSQLIITLFLSYHYYCSFFPMTLYTAEEGLCSSFLFIAFVHFSPPLQRKDIPARNAPHEAHTPALPFHGRILVSFAGNFVGSETLPSLVEIMRLHLHLPHVLNQVHYPSPFFRCFFYRSLSLSSHSPFFRSF